MKIYAIYPDIVIHGGTCYQPCTFSNLSLSVVTSFHSEQKVLALFFSCQVRHLPYKLGTMQVCLLKSVLLSYRKITQLTTMQVISPWDTCQIPKETNYICI